jgi:hypothetical protein
VETYYSLCRVSLDARIPPEGLENRKVARSDVLTFRTVLIGFLSSLNAFVKPISRDTSLGMQKVDMEIDSGTWSGGDSRSNHRSDDYQIWNDTATEWIPNPQAARQSDVSAHRPREAFHCLVLRVQGR